jgi:hypothetical protein
MALAMVFAGFRVFHKSYNRKVPDRIGEVLIVDGQILLDNQR